MRRGGPALVRGRSGHQGSTVVTCGMARTRLSTTVDSHLLDGARKVHAGTTDAELIDEALAALLSRYRSTEVDDAYNVAYRDHPIDEEDE